MKTKIIGLVPVLCLLLLFACEKKAEKPATGEASGMIKEKKMVVIKDYEKIDVVKQQLQKLAPVEIKADLTGLTKDEQQVLRLLVRAAMLMDRLFLRQVYQQNWALSKALEQGQNPDYKILLDYFRINFGPFDRLNNDQPFINLAVKKPAGANFYPADMSKEEFEQWIKAHPADEAAFTSLFTVISRKQGKLVATPYSQVFQKPLQACSRLLLKAAEKSDNPSLKKYLNSRAGALLTDDFFQSDIDWVDVKDHRIEVVIGPYEVYEDKLFGYKASYEAFITIVDQKESEKLAILANYLDEMERHLPIEDKYKNFARGKSSPILVVNEVFTGGDTKAGIQTTAYNLPNDERVREAKGSKKVMLKNVAQAKFENCWIPIVKEVLGEKELSLVSFDAYFNHVMMHEISHALGPGTIIKNGKKTTVDKELKDLNPCLEEAKADIVGIWNLKFMIDKGVFPKELAKNIYPTYLGGMFRSIRFGLDSAHGGGTAVQANYILEKGGFTVDEKTGRFSVDDRKIQEAIKQLCHDILTIQALGDYQAAKALIDRYRVLSPKLQRAVDAVKHVPIDIFPIYSIGQQAGKKKK